MARILVIQKRFKYWSLNTQAKLKRLTLGENWGRMHGTISKNPDLMTFVCWRGGKILGWALYIHKRNIYGYKEAWFYIRCKNRRQGIGTRLMSRIMKYRTRVGVTPGYGNEKGKSFFKKMQKRFGEKRIVR